MGIGLGIERFHGMKALFMTGQVGLEVIGMHQVQRRTMQAVIDPGQPRGIKGIGKHTNDHVVMAQQHEFAFEALGQSDPVEYRGGLEQGIGVQNGVVQRATEAFDERHGGQFTEYP